MSHNLIGDEAEAIQQMRTKTKHHLPRVYLKAWAKDNRVAFRRRDMHRATVADVKKVGAVNHLYTDEAETVFSKTESAVADPLKRLGSGAKDLSDTDRQVLAQFIVELMTRQIYMATFRGLSTETFKSIVKVRRDTEAVLRLLRADHGPSITRADAERLQSDIQETFLRIQHEQANHNLYLPDDDFERHILEHMDLRTHEIRSMVVAAESVAASEGLMHFLLTEQWQLCESHKAEFITSDQPVFYHPTWLNLSSNRPLGTICFVVSPTILLKIAAKPENHRWGKEKVFKLNRYVAEHCDHQIISTPSNVETLNRLRLGAYRPWVFAGTG